MGNRSGAMAGATKFSLLFYNRLRLHPHSLFILAQKSYSTSTTTPARKYFFPMPGHHPRRWCFSRAEAQSQIPYPTSPVLHWPEWQDFVKYLTARGYTGRRFVPSQTEEEEFSLDLQKMPEDFRNSVVACLFYAREWPELLRSLSKKEIEVLVANGSPFLFKESSDSVSRMKSFIGNQGNDASPSAQACTVDLMRYLLSYAWKFLNLNGGSSDGREKLVESSVRALLRELVKFCSGTHGTDSANSSEWNAVSGDYDSQKRLNQTNEMKKGDWLCPKCKFMNFARNIKCLECNEARPKKQLTGGDWECPQCDFFNYARNMKCLRCDCKCPEGIPPSKNPGLDQILHSGTLHRAEIERRLAENDEKAERWFSKISQLDSSSDLSNAIEDEDFPEIMPLRKGMNRFVISTRKTPLERRMANLTSKGGMTESTVSQTLDRILGSGASKESNLTSMEKRYPNMVAQQEPNKYMSNGGSNQSSHDTSTYATKESSHERDNQHVVPPPYKRRIAVDQANNSNFIPFVPLPHDYFAKKESQQNQALNLGQQESQRSQFPSLGRQGSQLSHPPCSGQQESQQSQHWRFDQRQRQLSEPPCVYQEESQLSHPACSGQQESHIRQQWNLGQRGSQLSQLPSVNQEESHIRQQWNLGQRGSQLSQLPSVDHEESHIRQQWNLGQRGSQQSQRWSFDERESQQGQSSRLDLQESLVRQPPNFGQQESQQWNLGQRGSEHWRFDQRERQLSQPPSVDQEESLDRQQCNLGQRGSQQGQSSRLDLQESQVRRPPSFGHQESQEWSLGQQSQHRSIDQQESRQNQSPGLGLEESQLSQPAAFSQQESQQWNLGQQGSLQSQSLSFDHRGSEQNQPSNIGQRECQQSVPENSDNWFARKSLEGSAVTETDPLDMSEEAKAQRWFQRVSQIKDISELSNIPDEDFPEIMPLRKGVNRFVVSKRKTPLERRLTSPQYRRNLPIMSSSNNYEKDPTRTED